MFFFDIVFEFAGLFLVAVIVRNLKKTDCLHRKKILGTALSLSAYVLIARILLESIA